MVDFVLLFALGEVRGSAEEVRAEKIKEQLRSAVPIAALPLKIELTFNSGLLSDVFDYPSASCASPFFPMTRPLALGVLPTSAEVGGLLSLMRCAERTELSKAKIRV